MHWTYASAIVANCSSLATRLASARCRSVDMWNIPRNSSNNLALASLRPPWARNTLITWEYDSSSKIDEKWATLFVFEWTEGQTAMFYSITTFLPKLSLMAVHLFLLQYHFFSCSVQHTNDNLPSLRKMPRHSSLVICSACGHIMPIIGIRFS